MKLFLSSAGIQPETKEEFLKLLGKDPKEVKVAFIPTAGYPEIKQKYIDEAFESLNDIGITDIKIVDLKEEDEDSLLQKLKDVNLIWVNGGNTFWLLNWVRKSGFDKIIKGLLDNGAIYLGVSAGSYIACPNIEMSTWKSSEKDRCGVTDFQALGLTDFLMSVHYEDKYKDEIENGVKTTKLPVVVLTDEQAVVVDDDKIILAGPKEVLTFNGFEFKE